MSDDLSLPERDDATVSDAPVKQSRFSWLEFDAATQFRREERCENRESRGQRRRQICRIDSDPRISGQKNCAVILFKTKLIYFINDSKKVDENLQKYESDSLQPG